MKVYKGLGVAKEITEVIGEKAYERGPKALKKVVEGLGDKKVLETIKDYQDLKEVAELLGDIGEKVYGTRNPKVVKKVARDLMSRLK